MNIYIDESGSFVNASTVGSWNAVAALAVPEAADEKIGQLLAQLRILNGYEAGKETKLNDLTEDTYIQFIGNLADLNTVVFSTDSVSAHYNLGLARFNKGDFQRLLSLSRRPSGLIPTLLRQ